MNSPFRRLSAPRARESRSNCSGKTRWWLSLAVLSGWVWPDFAALPALLRMAAGQLPGALRDPNRMAGDPVYGRNLDRFPGLVFGLAAAVKHAKPAVSAALGASGRSLSVSRKSQSTAAHW